MSADSEEGRIECIKNLFDSDVFADCCVVPHFNTHFFDDGDFSRKLFFGESVRGNAEIEHATEFVVGLEYGDCVTGLSQFYSTAHTRGAAADDGHLFPGIRTNLRNGDLPFTLLEIGNETFQRADGDGLFNLASPQTFILAGMGADAAYDAGERKPFSDKIEGFEESSFRDESNVVPCIEIDWTAVYAGGNLPVDHVGGRDGLGKTDESSTPP